MNYIIHPAIFYLISVANSIKMAGIVFGFLLVVCIIVYIIIYFVTIDDEEYQEPLKKHKNIVYILVIGAAICLCIGLLLPSKETSYAMLVAKIANKENLTMTQQTIKEIVDYIVQSFNLIKG